MPAGAYVFEVELDGSGVATVGEGEPLWRVDTPCTRAWVRLSPEREVWCLLWTPERWVLVGEGKQRDLSRECAGALPIVELVFAGRAVPTVVCATQSRGLQAIALAPLPTRRPRPS